MLLPPNREEQMARLASVLCSLFVSACALSTEPRLSYEGRSAIVATSPTIVDAVVTVRNTGSTMATIPTPVCPLGVAVYFTPERNGMPRWTSAPDTCVTTGMMLPPITIAPGDFYDFTARAIVPTTFSGQRVFLAMSVPSGRAVPVGQLTVK
jgi:hypothetical protein